MKIPAKALIFTLIATVTLLCAAPSSGWALLVPAHGADAPDRAADMKKVQSALESKIVRERLKGLGLTEAETNSRLAKLSDQDLHKFAKDVDSLSAGGLIEEILVLVILVLLIVYLVHRV